MPPNKRWVLTGKHFTNAKAREELTSLVLKSKSAKEFGKTLNLRKSEGTYTFGGIEALKGVKFVPEHVLINEQLIGQTNPPRFYVMLAVILLAWTKNKKQRDDMHDFFFTIASSLNWQTQWAKMTSADFMNIQRKLSELSGVAINETVEAAQEQQMANQANIANMTYEEAREQFLAEFSKQTTDQLILDLIGYTMLNMADSQELDGKRETNPEKLENNIRIIDPRWQQAWQNNTNLDQQASNDLLDDLWAEIHVHRTRQNAPGRMKEIVELPFATYNDYWEQVDISGYKHRVVYPHVDHNHLLHSKYYRMLKSVSSQGSFSDAKDIDQPDYDNILEVLKSKIRRKNGGVFNVSYERWRQTLFLDSAQNVPESRKHLYYPGMGEMERHERYAEVERGLVDPADPDRGYPNPELHPYLDDWINILLHLRQYYAVSLLYGAASKDLSFGYLPYGVYTQNASDRGQGAALGANDGEADNILRNKFAFLGWDSKKQLRAVDNTDRFLRFDPLRPCTWSYWSWVTYWDIEEFKPSYPVGNKGIGKTKNISIEFTAVFRYFYTQLFMMDNVTQTAVPNITAGRYGLAPPVRQVFEFVPRAVEGSFTEEGAVRKQRKVRGLPKYEQDPTDAMHYTSYDLCPFTVDDLYVATKIDLDEEQEMILTPWELTPYGQIMLGEPDEQTNSFPESAKLDGSNLPNNTDIQIRRKLLIAYLRVLSLYREAPP